jgi:hypothetical protein
VTSQREVGHPVEAVLGTGTMGTAMARSVATAGMALRVWNRNRTAAAPLADVGAVVCASPDEACRGADVVLTTLANEAVTAEVMERARDGLADGAVWLQCCTVAPEGRRRLAAQADRLCVDFVEAPLLGAKEPAVAATPQTDVPERVRPVLDAVGSRTPWLDGIGQPRRFASIPQSSARSSTAVNWTAVTSGARRRRWSATTWTRRRSPSRLTSRPPTARCARLCRRADGEAR